MSVDSNVKSDLSQNIHDVTAGQWGRTDYIVNIII